MPSVLLRRLLLPRSHPPHLVGFFVCDLEPDHAKRAKPVATPVSAGGRNADKAKCPMCDELVPQAKMEAHFYETHAEDEDAGDGSDDEVRAIDVHVD